MMNYKMLTIVNNKTESNFSINRKMNYTMLAVVNNNT